jgi:hypothetical protein
VLRRNLLLHLQGMGSKTEVLTTLADDVLGCDVVHLIHTVSINVPENPDASIFMKWMIIF